MRVHGKDLSRAVTAAGACAVLTLTGVSAGTRPAAAAGHLATSLTGPAATGGAATGPAATGGADTPAVPVIIFLKQQPAASSGGARQVAQRAALLQAAQEPYADRLRLLGATHVLGFRLVNAIAARVPRAVLGTVAASPGVASVIPDSPIFGPSAGPSNGPSTGVFPPSAATAALSSAAAQTPAGACSATPRLAPEALPLTGTASDVKGAQTARSLGYTGAGVTVAFLGDGIDAANPNLMRGGQPVITDYKDFSGDGTAADTAGGEAFTDANAIAGQGSDVYNLSGFGAQGPAGACNIQVEGSAPGASLVALKVFSQANTSTTSAFLQAIDYAVNTDHVNVLDESFGSNPFPDVTSLDAVKEFNDMAVAAGTTVVVAAGDAGPSDTIGSPASDPEVISVGASTDLQFYAQTDYAGADQFAKNGWQDGSVSALSSGGFNQDGTTLDMVAPADMSFASCTPSAVYSSCVNFLGRPSPLAEAGGTSQSAGLTAGAAALVIQAYAQSHGGTHPSPAQVKQFLLSTATDLGAPATAQGAGQLNSLKAVELASWMAHCDPVGSTLRLSANQLNYTGKPGATANWAVTVTNTGKAAQDVSVYGRGLSAPTAVKSASVTLSDAASPHYAGWAGAMANYGTVTFAVPRGAEVLNASIAWPSSTSTTGSPTTGSPTTGSSTTGSSTTGATGASIAGASASANSQVRVTLVSPAGKLAADSAPQGASGYGSVQVEYPAAGTWTAVISSNEAAAGGTAGTVQFGASVSYSTGFGAGSASPRSMRLSPGQSGLVRLSARVPAEAGDTSGSLVFVTGKDGDTQASSAAGDSVSIPVTMRGELTPAAGAPATFSGALTGGNGRAPGEGQVAAYSVTVPAGAAAPKDIDADLTLASLPASQVSAYLVAPDGETMGYGSSYLTTGFSAGGVPVEQPQRALSLQAADPVPGTWTLIVDFTSPGPGAALADPFTGRVAFNGVSAGRGTLPDSAAVKLARGKAAAYRITVRDTGAAPEDIFTDPRLTATGTYRLQPQDHAAKLQVPLPATSTPPEWIVPPMTSSVAAVAHTAPAGAAVAFDFGPYPGDPDEAATSGNVAQAVYPPGTAVTPVTPGLWFAMPSQVGPYGVAGAARETATVGMTAVTQQFDTSAVTSTGDFWQFGVVSLAAHASYSLLRVSPGRTVTITVTVTPTAAVGTRVSGTLYVDDFVDSPQFLSGSTLAAIPYEYTVS